jgi:hypothetical protein
MPLRVPCLRSIAMIGFHQGARVQSSIHSYAQGMNEKLTQIHRNLGISPSF